MLASGIVPDEIVYTALIHAFQKSRKKYPEKIVKYSEMMRRQGFEINPILLRILLRAYADLRRFTKLEEVIDELLERGRAGEISLDVKTINIMFEVLKEMQGGLNKMEEIWYEMKEGIKTKKPKKEETGEEADTVVPEVLEAKDERWLPQPDLTSFNILIETYIRHRKKNRAIDHFREMQARGFKPDQRTYSQIMSLAGAKKESDGAEKAYKTMRRDKNFVPKPTVFLSVIDTYIKASTPEKALPVLQEMRSFGFKPNLQTYNRLLASFARLRPNVVPKLFQDMKADGVAPNEKTKMHVKAAWEKTHKRNL